MCQLCSVFRHHDTFPTVAARGSNTFVSIQLFAWVTSEITCTFLKKKIERRKRQAQKHRVTRIKKKETILLKMRGRKKEKKKKENNNWLANEKA